MKYIGEYFALTMLMFAVTTFSLGYMYDDLQTLDENMKLVLFSSMLIGITLPPSIKFTWSPVNLFRSITIIIPLTMVIYGLSLLFNGQTRLVIIGSVSLFLFWYFVSMSIIVYTISKVITIPGNIDPSSMPNTDNSLPLVSTNKLVKYIRDAYPELNIQVIKKGKFELDIECDPMDTSKITGNMIISDTIPPHIAGELMQASFIIDGKPVYPFKYIVLKWVSEMGMKDKHESPI